MVSAAVEKVAMPDARLVVPITVVPSEKVTVPVGIAAPEVSLTDALKLIEVPEIALVDEAVSCVVVTPSVGAPETVSLSAADTDAA